MREDPLIEFDVVQNRAKTPVLNEGVARHLAVVHHACNDTENTHLLTWTQIKANLEVDQCHTCASMQEKLEY